MRKLKCFIAGSKQLESERDILKGVLMNMQGKWDITVEVKTFESFNSTVSRDGQQNDYNKYISEESDLVVYIFGDSIGSITMEEFIIAYKGKISKNHPDILVFCNSSITDTYNFKIIKTLINSLRFYYVEYSDHKDLRSKFSEEADKYIKKNYKEKNIFKWFINDFVKSNKYACAKNWCLFLLSMALCFMIAFSIVSHTSNRTQPDMEVVKQTKSVYDGKVIQSEMTIKTTNHIVRVEDLGNDNFRYLAWNINRGESGSPKPSLVLENGYRQNGFYRFKSGSFFYMVPFVEKRQLQIMSNDKIYAEEDIVDSTYNGKLEQENTVNN